jgi:hypothetical protein
MDLLQSDIAEAAYPPYATQTAAAGGMDMEISNGNTTASTGLFVRVDGTSRELGFRIRTPLMVGRCSEIRTGLIRCKLYW